MSTSLILVRPALLALAGLLLTACVAACGAPPCTEAGQCVRMQISEMETQARLLERVTGELSAVEISGDLTASMRRLKRIMTALHALPPEAVQAAEADQATALRTALERLGRAHGTASVHPDARGPLIRAMEAGSR